MILKKQETQKAIQVAVKLASAELGGEKNFTDAFAESCLILGLNEYLPDGIAAIPVWNEIEYTTPHQRLFRYLGLKETGGKKVFNIEFFNVMLDALLLAMPKQIRLDLRNSQDSVIGIHNVSRNECQESDSIQELKMPSIKEASEFVAAAAAMPETPDIDMLKGIVKEGPEAIIAIEAFVALCGRDLDQKENSSRSLRSVKAG